MKKSLLLSFLLITVCMNAQYYKAKLLMTDGTVKEGMAELPSNKLLEKNVNFKSSQNAVAEKLPHDEIYKIQYTTNQGHHFLFERNNVVHLYKSFGKEIETEKTQKHWMLLFHSNKKLNGYSLSQRYKIDKDGVMHSITGANSIWEFVYFLLKRTDEDKGYIVSAKGFTNGQVRKAMAIYFKDVPELVTRIENKEFTNSNVEDVADVYAGYFKSED